VNRETNNPAALAHEAIYEAVGQALRDEPRGRLLDVPAGHGALAKLLTSEGFDVVCCDLYPEIFDLENVPVDKGNLDETFPYEDDSFDLAVCIEGLEHIENPTNAIREFSRVLKSGGSLVVSIPNIMNIEERLKWLIYGYTSHFKPLSKEAIQQTRDAYPGMEEIGLHVNPISYSELRYLLEKFGFKVEKALIDKRKRNSWAYWPLVTAIKLFGGLNSKKRRRERWTDGLNSNEVLAGGNTLIFKARKI
jgi:ubiquinone/menaquinone biosynthesis C-methylase UbiE